MAKKFIAYGAKIDQQKSEYTQGAGSVPEAREEADQGRGPGWKHSFQDGPPEFDVCLRTPIKWRA